LPLGWYGSSLSPRYIGAEEVGYSLRMLFRIGALAIALLFPAIAAEKQTLNPAERQLNLDSFEYIWKTVRDKHWDPKPGGLDWQAVHDKLRPQVEKADTMEKARGVMEGMLERLKQSHFAVVPGALYKEMESGGAREGSSGIDVRVIDGHALVVSVDQGTPAAARGVKPGWEIVRIDGKPLAPVLRKLDEAFGKSTLRDIVLSRSVISRMAGKTGSNVLLDFLDANDSNIGLELERVRPRGVMAKLGFLPPMYFWVESRKVRPDIGYVRFNMFFEPEKLIATVEEAVKNCRDCAGFVIDLRGNPGGIGGLAMGVAGWFIDKPDQRLGTMYMRDNSIKFIVNPRLEPFRGPLAILVDGCSGSSSEIFAGGLKDLKRARIFGTRSAGAALPSVFEKLPNGDGFQYAFANYISEGGKPLEGIGVIPDEEVKITRAQLLAGQDQVADAAVSWIGKATR
jgi:carboxyl-terminal processing protease